MLRHPRRGACWHDRCSFPVRDIMYLATSSLVAVYAFLQIRGVCEAFPREPFIPLPAAEVEAM